MKNFFVLSYDMEVTSIEELQDIFNLVRDALPPEQSIICLPDIVSLKSCTKDQLKIFLDNYKKMVEGLFNE